MENQKNNIWRVGFYVGVLLVVFLAVLSVKELKSIGYVGRNYPNIITVSGKADVVAIPDIASVYLTVTENAKVINDVQGKASEKINKVIASLKENGVDEKDIKTTSYSINPHYEYSQPACTVYVCPPGKSVLSGYDVSQSLEVKIRDLKNAGKLLEVIGSLNVQNVSGLSFTIDDIDKLKEEARNKAIDDAKSKAQDLAKRLGVNLGDITSFYDASDENSYYYAKGGMEADVRMVSAVASVAPQVPSGEQKITSKVSVSYEIR